MIVVQCYLDSQRKVSDMVIIGCIEDSIHAEDFDLIQSALWCEESIEPNSSYHVYLRRALYDDNGTSGYEPGFVVAFVVELREENDQFVEPVVKI